MYRRHLGNFSVPLPLFLSHFGPLQIVSNLRIVTIYNPYQHVMLWFMGPDLDSPIPQRSSSLRLNQWQQDDVHFCSFAVSLFLFFYRERFVESDFGRFGYHTVIIAIQLYNRIKTLRFFFRCYIFFPFFRLMVCVWHRAAFIGDALSHPCRVCFALQHQYLWKVLCELVCTVDARSKLKTACTICRIFWHWL